VALAKLYSGRDEDERFQMKLYLLAPTCLTLLLLGERPSPRLLAQDRAQPTADAAPQKNTGVGEKIPSEDDRILDFHSHGLINGHTNVFRSASPVRDLVDSAGHAAPQSDAEVKLRMQRLRDLGIRTIISFENPDANSAGDQAKDEGKLERVRTCAALEKTAAAQAGIQFISHPLVNSGAKSFEDQSDDAVCKSLDAVADQIFAAADNGGILFHCSAGHDRTGIVAAYMRMKYQHWPVDQAIDEMRRLGHNWPKFSHNDGKSSWHEDHLRAISEQLFNSAASEHSALKKDEQTATEGVSTAP
jgi:protein-tyrosine phosphatase